MANLRDISRRMNSIRSTMQITRTMEMISTARIRAALEQAESAGPYKEAITRILQNVAAAAGERIKEPLLIPHEQEKHVLFILMGSDRGLAGGFNVGPQRIVDREMARLRARGIQTSIITCGRKATEYFTTRGTTPVMSFVGISSTPNRDQADRIVSYIMEGYNSVVVEYWHAKSRVDQEFVSENLLPLTRDALMMPNDPRAKTAYSIVEEHSSADFEFEPSADEVLSFLVPAYLRTVVFHALLDSAAAEHGARRRAMQSATENAQEVLGQLSHTYNRIRQGSITTELNEIIGGASALEESD